jgi:GTPase SAR1 family protein
METVPTVGMEVKLVKRGGLNMKCWDIGGQAHYRSQWGRYTRGCDVIIYVVDAHAVMREHSKICKISHHAFLVCMCVCVLVLKSQPINFLHLDKIPSVTHHIF